MATAAASRSSRRESGPGRGFLELGVGKGWGSFPGGLQATGAGFYHRCDSIERLQVTAGMQRCKEEPEMSRTRKQDEYGSSQNVGSAAEDNAVRSLRSALEGLGARRLHPSRRVALLDAATAPGRRVALGTPAWGLAAAAAALMLALAPLLLQGDPVTGPASFPTPVADDGPLLQVRSIDGQVQLEWSVEPGRAVRVLRSGDPRLVGAEDEIIEGTTWTDPKKNGSRVVYYRVEEIAG